MPNAITINNFQKGVGSSPYVGFGKMVGLDIYRKPGIIQAGSTTYNNGESYPNLPVAEVVSLNGDRYVGTYDGTVYKNGSSYCSGLSSIHDLLIIGDDLIISNAGTTLTLIHNVTTTGTVVSSWQTGLTASTYGWKKMFLGQDNVIYIANETKLASITGLYSSGSLQAYTSWNSITLSCLSTGVPNNRIIQTICELNRYVVMGTSQNNTYGTYGNTKLYFMDRFMKDAAGTSFYLSMAVEIPERKVNLMISKNNRLYLFGADTGTFYTANTTTYQEITHLPNRLQAQQFNDTFPSTPNSVALLNDEILFGIGGGYNSAYDVVYGVYSLKDTSVICKHILSTGNYGQTNNSGIRIGSIYVTSNQSYDIGWQDGTTYGMDTSLKVTGGNYNAWFESPFYETGTAINPRTFETIQFNFGPNLVDDQKLRVSYRTAQNASWSTPVVYDYATYGGVNSLHGKFPTIPTTNLQLKVEFNTLKGSGLPSDYGTNIELQSIILL